MESKSEVILQPKVLYNTFSYCPHCIFVAKKGLELTPATVISKEQKIFLRVQCKTHGSFDTLYCSNEQFFLKTSSFSFNLPGTEIPKIPDLEDLKTKLKYNPQSPNLPLILELPLWENGDFVPDAKLKSRVEYYQSLYPSNKRFILKLIAKLSNDMEELNKKILFVESLVKGSMLLVEASYERLVLLSQLTNSFFMKATIFPALKYFLRQGDEEQCKKELTELFEILKTFSDMSLVVTLCVNRPYPKLDALLSFMRDQFGFIRVIIISTERSPKDLVQSVQSSSNEYLPRRMERGEMNAIDSIDIYELLEFVQKSTYHSVTVDDFVPMSMLTAMEPFLNMLGYGWFSMRASPFCGFITCLLNTDRSFISYPMSRLFQFEKLFNDLKPLLPRLQDGKIGVYNATKLKRILQKCVVPNKGPMPDVYSYLTDKNKQEELTKFLQNLQFIIVHNNMDVAAFDMARRCNCIMGTYAPANANSHNIASYCTGCI